MKKLLVTILLLFVLVQQQGCILQPPICVDGPYQQNRFVITSTQFNYIYPYAYMNGSQCYYGCQGQPFYYDQRYPNYWPIYNAIRSQGWVVVSLSFDPFWGPVLSY